MEPLLGLDPTTLRSVLELKPRVRHFNQLSHPGTPEKKLLCSNLWEMFPLVLWQLSIQQNPYECFVFKDFIYLFMRHRERGRDVGRRRSRRPMGTHSIPMTPVWDSIPGPRDHDLS